MLTVAAALALLPTLTLDESAPIAGAQVRRATLFGYEVQGQVLTADEAAQRLASLQARVASALRVAGARLRQNRITGRFHTHARVRGGRDAILVAPYIQDWTSRKQVEVMVEVVEACRKEGLEVERGDGEVWCW